jgi:hypothetical protein
MSEKQRRGNGIGIRVRRDVPLIAPPAGQFADVVQGFEVQRTGTFVQYRIAQGLRPGRQRERMVPAHLDRLWKTWRSRSCALLLISQHVCFGAPQATDARAACIDRRPIEHLIYNFPVLISSRLLRIGVQFPD